MDWRLPPEQRARDVEALLIGIRSRIGEDLPGLLDRQISDHSHLPSAFCQLN
jgi:hypothetical protein